MTCPLTYPLVQWGTQSHVVLVENICALGWFYLQSDFLGKKQKSTLAQDLG